MRIRQDDLLERIREAQLELENYENSFEEQRKLEGEANSIQLRQIEQEKANQQQQIQNLALQLNAQYALLKQVDHFSAAREWKLGRIGHRFSRHSFSLMHTLRMRRSR